MSIEQKPTNENKYKSFKRNFNIIGVFIVIFILGLTIYLVLHTAEQKNIYKIKLNIPTYDGSGQAMHPSIYYNSSGLWGFKYWLLMTPYPNSKDYLENPSIMASNDGITWVKPSWITNPIEPYAGVGRHNDDPDMVYNSSADRLECYWLNSNNSDGTDNFFEVRYVNNTGVSSRITTTGGGNTLGVDLKGGYTKNSWGMHYPVSPAFILDNDTYCAYVIEARGTHRYEPKPVYLYKSYNGLNFTFVKRLNISSVPEKDIWHMDAERTINGVNFLFSENDLHGSKNHTLYLGKSTSYTGNVSVQLTPLLVPMHDGSWDDYRIYRSCSVTDPDGYGINIWYSARNAFKVWNTGFIRVEPNSQGKYRPIPLSNNQLLISTI